MTASLPPTATGVEETLDEVMTRWPVVLGDREATSGTVPRSVERFARALGPLLVANRPWPERLLRLSCKPGGKVALWLRDYTLSAEAVPPLVARLHEQASKEGIVLERVVINGTTVWQSELIEGEA